MSSDLAVVERQRQVATSVGVPSARRHIFLCCNQTKPKCCEKANSLESWEYLKQRLAEFRLFGQGAFSVRRQTACACVTVVRWPSSILKARGMGAARLPCLNESSRSISWLVG